MDFKIKKIAVIGAGIMGAGIAAHLANCGLEVLLLDILPAELSEEDKNQNLTYNSTTWRNKLPRAGLKSLLNSKRPVFSSVESYDRIKIGNLDDDIEKIADYDWILETIVENIDIKKQLYARIEKIRRKDSVVTTNTSGLPISSINAKFSSEFKKYFMGTHFFNPPTYAPLLEIVPGKETFPELTKFMKYFCQSTLHKSPIIVKDSPNFIANRLGVANMVNVFHLCQEKGYSVEEVDAVCGRAMGRMRTALFMTADAVGLETVCNVTRNLYDNVKFDEKRESFYIPEFVHFMVKNGWMGDKVHKGFYMAASGSNQEEMVFDLNTLQYRKKQIPSFPCLQDVEKLGKPAEKVKKLINGTDRGALLAWEILSNDLCYVANRIGEIADTIFDIDNAMKWGYSWRLGPFEAWDAIGLVESVKRMKKEEKLIPLKIEKMLSKGYSSFYAQIDSTRYFYDFQSESYLSISL